MINTAILYKSKYGATKKYVSWLEEELSCSVFSTDKADIKNLASYDSILLAGGIYASGISGIRFLNKHYGQLKDKKIAVFAVGASPFNEKALSQLRTLNLKNELSRIPLFYGRGSWDESKMSFPDRTMCRMLKKSVSKKEPSQLEPWMEALLEASDTACDWTDKSYLTPLLAYFQPKVHP